MLSHLVNTSDTRIKIYDASEVVFLPMWEDVKPAGEAACSFAQLEISNCYQYQKRETIYRVYSKDAVEDVMAASADEALDKYQGIASKIEYISNKAEPIVLPAGLTKLY